jgi:sugar-phosphatase
MNVFDAVLFDMDGVLLHSTPIHREAWSRLFKEEGYLLLPGWYEELASGRSRDDVLRSVLGPAGASPERMARKEAWVLRALHEHGCTPVPGAPALLRALAASEVPYAVATSSRMPGPFLQAAGLGPWTPVRRDRTHVARGKPAPDLFLAAAEALGVDPQRCLVLEDAPAGIRAGRTAGCTVVALATTHPASDLHEAHRVVPGFAALYRWAPLRATLDRESFRTRPLSS